MFYVGGPQQRIDLSLLILKACSYQYNDPDLNGRTLVAGYVSRIKARILNQFDCSSHSFMMSGFEYITCAPPVPDILSALESFNPDFLCSEGTPSPHPLLVWLKVSALSQF
jgi:hypothetical protein